jgi:uncharacterized protein (TIGR03083 family)
MGGEHAHDPDVPAGWALAATPDEADRLLAMFNGCAHCATEAARLREVVHWLGAVEPVQPRDELRERVLSRARAARRSTAATPVEVLAYAAQVESLDALLAGLGPPDWGTAVVGDRDVRGLVRHLTSNDALVTADLGVGERASGEHHIRRRWRERATALLAEVTPRPADRFDEPVRLAGRRPAVGPLRDGLIQRAFETWIHADDIRTALALPSHPPPPEHLRLIADLGARLLPTALAALGTRRPGRWARLVLADPGGGNWDVPLGPGPVGAEPDTVLTLDAVEFCRLLAGRRAPVGLCRGVEGDPGLARLILEAATTLGCE